MGCDPNLDTCLSNTYGLLQPCRKQAKDGSEAISQSSEMQLNNFLIELPHGVGNVLSEHYTTGERFGSNLYLVLLVCS